MATLLRNIRRFEELIAVLCYAIMFLMVIGEIVARELISSSIYGSENVAVLASAIAGFVGYSLVTQAGRHLRATFFDSLVPEHFSASFDRLSDLISAALYFAISFYALKFAIESYGYRDVVEILYWPLWPFQLAIFYAFFVSGVKHLLFAIRSDLRPVKNLGH